MAAPGDEYFTSPTTSVAMAFTSAGSRRWYLGGLVGSIWLVNAGFEIWGQYPAVTDRAITTILLVLYGVSFLIVPPLNRLVDSRYKLLLPIGLLILSLALVPWFRWDVSTLWTYVGVAAAMSMVRMRTLVLFVAVLSATSYYVEYRGGASGDSQFAIPGIIAMSSLMMGALARQILATQQLRATRHELARLAVDQERSRVARDLHDILGHSLTVITVKAELAGRLIDVDPVRAGKEIADLEDLARGALADVRSTVAGFRGVSIATELANARSALEAAGIRSSLPASVDEVPSGLRELFGWTVREGVTNIVRHSSATNASITLGRDFVEIIDDGRGSSDAAVDGNGLNGLRERVDASGARMAVGRTIDGGFRLKVIAPKVIAPRVTE